MTDVMKRLDAIRVKLIAAQSKRDVLVGKSQAALEELKKHGFASVDLANEEITRLDK